jgi:DNA repair exonuclease SbcCD ATPase subunit
MYKKSGIDANVQEIKTLRANIDFYEKNIATLLTEIDDVNRSLKVIDEQIGLVSKYIESKKYKKVFESTIESTDKILAPLETANNERIDCEYKLRNITDQINLARDSARQLENKINEYRRLTEEGTKLSKRLDDLNIILESVSTKKGIPVIYMKQYLGKIQKLSNDLLSIIYEDELRLSKFKVTQDTFEVPYVKNGMKVVDVKYASQSEIALITMALSFALANRASGKYNILLLDEIDAGLDETNRNAFLKMLHKQMETLKCEQVFIISHNLSQMVNVPMDCIKLSDDIPTTKLQNVIYE